MAALWERQESDTEKSWEAFVTYRDLGAGRSLKAAAEALGKHRSLVEEWSRTHNWRERVEEYDRWIDHTALAVRQIGHAEFQQALNQKLQITLALFDRIVGHEIQRITEAQQRGDKVNMLELKRLISAIAEADTLARRSASLPTQYRSESVEDVDHEDAIVYIGG